MALEKGKNHGTDINPSFSPKMVHRIYQSSFLQIHMQAFIILQYVI